MWILTRASPLLLLIYHPQRLKHLQVPEKNTRARNRRFSFTCRSIKPECLWSPKPCTCPKRGSGDGTSPGGHTEIQGRATANPPLVQSMVNTRWEYGKVTWALLDFTPLTHKWEHTKACWFNCIISWDWFFHIWGLNSHCVCKILYFCTFLVLSLLRRGQGVYYWYPGFVTTRNVVHAHLNSFSSSSAHHRGEKNHIIWNTLVEFSVVWASNMQNYMWIFRGSSWNQNYFSLKKELQLVSCPGKSLQWNSQGHSWHMQAEQFQIISLHHKKLWENVHFSLLCYKSRKKNSMHCDHYKEQRVSTAAERALGVGNMLRHQGRYPG